MRDRTALVGLLASLAVVVTIAAGYALGYRQIDIAGAFLIPAALAGLTVPLLHRSERGQGSSLGGVLALALLVKFIGGYLRYVMVFHLYEEGDAQRYLDAGQELAFKFWNADMGTSEILPHTQGTPFIEELSGLVQTVIGPNSMGAFMVFSWLAFLGMLAFVAAARIAVPRLDVRRYAILTLFLPSLVFWPSSVGKDAWMVLALGVFALGAARIYTAGRFGYLLAALSVVGMGMVRPHVALLALAALAVGLAVRSRRTMNRGSSGGRTAVAVVLLVSGFAFTTSQAAQLLPGAQDGSLDVSATLQETTRRSTQGGSEVEVTAPNSPLEYPQAFFTVVFRPLIFEANSLTAAVAAVEGTALLALVIVSRRRLYAAIRQAAANSYLLMSGLYVLGFAFAWSSIGNLGIIARQRVQVLPFLLLFVCVFPGSQSSGDAPQRPTSVVRT